ncbi:hypothetical protein P4O66_014350 [Electrophorus voltai]|uniref:Uncharacterized protein n=1 Tax=Electrophorus voltai TaxID=2609070 RepID=A0AAD8Z028_9TELE|nr:hypothetical protein P4O66_014350 [Electrophorus voltai]
MGSSLKVLSSGAQRREQGGEGERECAAVLRCQSLQLHPQLLRAVRSLQNGVLTLPPNASRTYGDLETGSVERSSQGPYVGRDASAAAPSFTPIRWLSKAQSAAGGFPSDRGSTQLPDAMDGLSMQTRLARDQQQLRKQRVYKNVSCPITLAKGPNPGQ